MFEVVIEASLQGLPEEQACIARLREIISSSNGLCTGSQASFVCSSGNTLIKVVLAAESPKSLQRVLLGEPLTALSLHIVVRGEKADDVVKVVDVIYKNLKGCNIPVRIL